MSQFGLPDPNDKLIMYWKNELIGTAYRIGNAGVVAYSENEAQLETRLPDE